MRHGRRTRSANPPLIYELIFFASENTVRHLFEAKPPPKALLSTCRQINKEATAMYSSAYCTFWSSSRFIVTDSAHMTRSYKELAGQFEERDFQRIEHLTLMKKSCGGLIFKEGLWRETVVDTVGAVSTRRYVIVPTTYATTYFAKLLQGETYFTFQLPSGREWGFHDVDKIVRWKKARVEACEVEKGLGSLELYGALKYCQEK